MKKKIYELIDELVICNIKIALILERGYRNLEEAKKVEKLNEQRSKLKNAIGEYFNESEEVKTYE